MIVVICLSRIARVELSFVTVIARVAGFAEVERARRVRGWFSGAASAAGSSPLASASPASASVAVVSAPASAAGAAAASDADEAVAASWEDAASGVLTLSSAALARQARGVSEVTRSESAARLAAPATPTRARKGRSRDINFSFFRRNVDRTCVPA